MMEIGLDPGSDPSLQADCMGSPQRVTRKPQWEKRPEPCCQGAPMTQNQGGGTKTPARPALANGERLQPVIPAFGGSRLRVK